MLQPPFKVESYCEKIIQPHAAVKYAAVLVVSQAKARDQSAEDRYFRRKLGAEKFLPVQEFLIICLVYGICIAVELDLAHIDDIVIAEYEHVLGRFSTL